MTLRQQGQQVGKGIIVVLVIVGLIVYFVRRGQARQKKRERDQRRAMEMREKAAATELDAREIEAKAAQARADAEQAQVDAERLRLEAEKRQADAQDLRASSSEQRGMANALDPDSGGNTAARAGEVSAAPTTQNDADDRVGRNTEPPSGSSPNVWCNAFAA